MTAQGKRKVNLTKVSDPIAPLDDAKVVELARGVLINQWLIVDIEDPRRERSLYLLLNAAGGVPANLGAILVPVADHIGGYWDGDVPGVTLVAQYVPQENLAHLEAELQRMRRALWPDEPATAPTSSTGSPAPDPT